MIQNCPIPNTSENENTNFESYTQNEALLNNWYRQLEQKYPLSQLNPIPLLKKALDRNPAEFLIDSTIAVPFGVDTEFAGNPCHTISCSVAHPKIDKNPENSKRTNEDAYYPNSRENLGQGVWAIFDGVSTQNGIASHLASKLLGKFVRVSSFKHFVDEYRKKYKIEIDIYNNPVYQNYLSILGKLYLETALIFINNSLAKLDSSLRTTAVVCLVANQAMIIANTGDSLAYLCDINNPNESIVVNRPTTEFSMDFLACFNENVCYEQIEQMVYQILYTNQSKVQRENICKQIINKLTIGDRYKIHGYFKGKNVQNRLRIISQTLKKDRNTVSIEKMQNFQRLIEDIPQKLQGFALLELIDVGNKLFGNTLVDLLNAGSGQLNFDITVIPFTNPHKALVIGSDGMERCGTALGFHGINSTTPANIPRQFCQNLSQALIIDALESQKRKPFQKLDDVAATCIIPIVQVGDVPIMHKLEHLYPNPVINPNAPVKL